MKEIIGLTVLLTIGIGYSIFLIAELFIEHAKEKKREKGREKEKMIKSFVRKGNEYVHFDGEDFDKLKIKFQKYAFDIYYNGERITKVQKINIELGRLTITRFIETENDLWLKK